MANERYRSTQVGVPIIVLVLVTTGTVAAITVATGVPGAALIVAGVTLMTILMVGWMTVTVDDTWVVVRFGAGLIRKRFHIGDIVSGERARSNWLHGIGVRKIRDGWLYNAKVGDAVQLNLAGGTRALIGADEPGDLLAAIEASRATAGAGPGSTRARPSLRGFALMVAVIVGVTGGAVWYQGRHMQVVVNNSGLHVRSGFYSVSIPFEEIREVIVADSLPRITRRTNGYAVGGVRRGHFRLDSLGDATLFLTLGHPPYVVVRSAETTTIIGFRNAGNAQQLINDLSRRSAEGPPR